MTLICIEFEPSAISPLWGIKVPGTPEPLSAAHCTVVYLGKNGSVEKDYPALVALEKTLKSVKPFQVTIRSISSFEPSESSDGLRPIIAKVESPELQALRKTLVANIRQQGVDFQESFPDYNPHVTLAYQDASEPWKDIKLATPLVMGVTSLSCLFGKHLDSQQTRLVVPLKLQPSAVRVAACWLTGCT